MVWLNELVGKSTSAKAVKAWPGMMSGPSESQLQRHQELIDALRKASPSGDVELELKRVTMNWDNEKNTVRVFLHFKRTNKMYSFIQRH